MKKGRWCNRANKVIFSTELEAKIALAQRVWKDKGEIRSYECHGHWHLTSMTLEAYLGRQNQAA